MSDMDFDMREITSKADITRMELAAGMRHLRRAGMHVNISIGPRDHLMEAVTPSGFHFITRPAYHPDDKPETPFLQAVTENLENFFANVNQIIPDTAMPWLYAGGVAVVGILAFAIYIRVAYHL